MREESETYDRKSLKLVTGRNPDWRELALDCVAFATARGGEIDIGIEDKETEPPKSQKIPKGLPDQIRRRIAGLTVNVEIHAKIHIASNNGEFIRLKIPRSESIPSTKKGHYVMRMSDGRMPVVGDQVMRLLTDRRAYVWETETGLNVSKDSIESIHKDQFLSEIHASDRVKRSVKNKTDDEILEHYALVRGEKLTNLGVLCLGNATDRNRLGTAPIVQAIKYDSRGEKIRKWAWDDYAMSPIQLVNDIADTIPDFQDVYEIAEGMHRGRIPAYSEIVVRELLVNALVHRPYVQGGDITLSLHPNKMKITNSGRLPVGVSPNNILHMSKRRNENLARIFHDLNLMEREGSGFDMIFETLLSQGRSLPVIEEQNESVAVTIERTPILVEGIKAINQVSEKYGLNQREKICFGILWQQGNTTVLELSEILRLEHDPNLVHDWMGRLPELGLVKATGRKVKFMGYDIISDAVKAEPVMTKQSDKIKDIILRDITDNPGSAIGDIEKRVSVEAKKNIGAEINRKRIQRSLDDLLAGGLIMAQGERRGRRYRPKN